MIEAINLTKSFGNQVAVNNLNLKIAPGDVFCLLGANGAGKTTTINLFMNFIRPSSGLAKINGLNANEQSIIAKKHLAYIPENLSLYGNLTGLENLQFFAGLSGISHSKADLEHLLVEVGLQQEAIHKRVSKFSKGMRQKVGIAIAKAKNADNLFLDEPTSGLDPQASNDFAQLLKNLRANGTAILMATHDLFRAKASGTHIGIMKSGKLVHSMNSEDISLIELEKLYLNTMQSTNS